MVKIFPDPERLLSALADLMVEQANDAIAARDVFNLALSGGSSPRALYRLLASESYRGKVEWSHVCFFFGDERYVPHDHIDSNFKMANDTLFKPLGISSNRIVAVDTSLPPSESARSYEKEIIGHLQAAPQFDMILLGLGDNSHTASLFPHTAVLHETKALVRETFVEEVDMYRITFTAPLINQARHVVFLVYGEAKAAAVQHVLEGPRDPEQYPAQLIAPTPGKVWWFLDQASARQIKRRS